MLGEARNPGIRAYYAEHTRNFLWHALCRTQVAAYVVLVWRCRSARHGSGCTRGSICRARAGVCSRWPGGVRKCGGIGACGHGRRSGPITMIATSVGRGDVGPFRHDGANVRRTAEALVVFGDGADAEHAHGTCSPWVEGELRHDVGGRRRRRTIIIVIALVIVIAARESACGDARAGGGTGNGGGRLDHGGGPRGQAGACLRQPGEGRGRTASGRRCRRSRP